MTASRKKKKKKKEKEERKKEEGEKEVEERQAREKEIPNHNGKNLDAETKCTPTVSSEASTIKLTEEKIANTNRINYKPDASSVNNTFDINKPPPSLATSKLASALEDIPSSSVPTSTDDDEEEEEEEQQKQIAQETSIDEQAYQKIQASLLNDHGTNNNGDGIKSLSESKLSNNTGSDSKSDLGLDKYPLISSDTSNIGDNISVRDSLNSRDSIVAFDSKPVNLMSSIDPTSPIKKVLPTMHSNKTNTSPLNNLVSRQSNEISQTDESVSKPATNIEVAGTMDHSRLSILEETFDVGRFDIENPDNTLSELLLYLEHQTVDVINTIQSLLSSIKRPKAKTGELRGESFDINHVIGQMVEATSVSMQQSRNFALKEHGTWVVQSLDDCKRRMALLCTLGSEFELLETDDDFADKHFKQRLAGIAFDVAKCTKELVKIVEEASLKEEIEYLNNRLNPNNV